MNIKYLILSLCVCALGHPLFGQIEILNRPGAIRDVQVIDAKTYMAVGNDFLYLSSDAGNTWDTMDLEMTNSPTEWADRLRFVDKDLGYVLTNKSITGINDRREERVYKTKNGGKTWEMLELPVSRPSLRSSNVQLFLPFDDTHIVSVKDHVIYQSSNGGDSWEMVMPLTFDILHLQGDLNADGEIYFTQIANSTHDDDGLIELYYSSDFGKNWSIIELPISDSHMPGRVQMEEFTAYVSYGQELFVLQRGEVVFETVLAMNPMIFVGGDVQLFVEVFKAQNPVSMFESTVSVYSSDNFGYRKILLDKLKLDFFVGGPYHFWEDILLIRGHGVLLRVGDPFNSSFDDQVKVIPNPIRLGEDISLQKNPQQTLDWTLINLQGQVLDTGRGRSHQISTQSIHIPGLYFLKLNVGNQQIARKVLIK